MENIEITEESIKAFDTYMEELIKRDEFVRSENYLNWLVSFLKIHDSFSDETWLYDQDKIPKEDYENVEMLSTFFRYIAELAVEQFIPENGYDYDLTYFFKLRGNYYEINNLMGQGSITFIKSIPFDNMKDFVLVDEETPENILKDRELVQYIIINKDYIGKIDSAKFGVHIGHVCTICAIEEHDSNNFRRWYKDSELQKKIIFTASTKKLEKLEEHFYSVRDLGFTEVENGTLLAVSLGIMSRKDAKPFIKGMQLWKGV